VNILIIHEIDWISKVPFEPHHLAEIFSIKGNNVYVIDCEQPNPSKIFSGMSTNILKNYNRLYDNASITIIRPPSILLKGLNRMTHYFSCKKIIQKILVEKDIDVILLYGIATNGIQTIQLSNELRIPVVFRLLDIAHEFVKIPILTQVTKDLERKVFKNATKILTTTEHLAKYAVNMGASEKNTEKFLYGVNTHVFYPMEKDYNLLNTLGIPETSKVIAFVGTIYDFSGLGTFVSKFKLINEKFPDSKLLIIGDGPYRSALEKIITKYDLKSNILITGFIEQRDIPKYLSLADICINTFDINNITKRIIPTKVLEYMACGKPVITTPLLGIKEFFPDESCGVSYSSTETFHESVIALLSNKNKMAEMAKEGSKYVKDTLNWDTIADLLLEKFTMLVKEKKINN